MTKVKFGDVIREVKTNIDRSNNPYKFFIAGEHMESEKLEISSKGEFSKADVGPAFTRLFLPGQVLYGSRRTYLKKVSVPDFAGITSNTTFVLETKDEALFKQSLLPFLLLSDDFTDFSVKNSKGSTNPYILFSDIAKYEFYLPSPDKQEEIASILLSGNETRVAYRRLLSALEELVKLRFLEIFGDPAINPYGLEVRPLSAIAEYYNGLTYKPGDVSRDGTGTIVLRASNIQDNQLDFSDIVRVNSTVKERLFVKENDVLMCSRSGSANLVGKVALIKGLDEPMSFGAFMMIIRSLYFRYLYTYFQMDDFRQKIKIGATTTINQITVGMLNDLSLPVPELSKVVEFAEFAEKTDSLKFVVQDSMEKLNDWIRAFTNQVFS